MRQALKHMRALLASSALLISVCIPCAHACTLFAANGPDWVQGGGTLIASGTPTEWCSAEALPPLPSLGNAERIREASRERYGALPSVEPARDSSSSTTETTSRRSHQKARQP